MVAKLTQIFFTLIHFFDEGILVEFLHLSLRVQEYYYKIQFY